MQRIDQVKNLLDEALRLPAGADRSSWLKSRCPDDPELREEVLSLAAAHSQMSRTTAIAPPAEPAIPTARFGAYRAVKLLGHGGMSAVYLAERADGQFSQTVALKIMAGYLAGPQFLRRFETERQLLATLQHHHITRLLDGGVSSSGDPYLITEYVQGQTLDRYCTQRNLGLEARLRLFLQICDAVDYAHRNLIVHRDLKPGNILVDESGSVKLLDFGTASLIADDATPVTHVRMLTPRYASPEQLRGERLGIATDIYSLGVILYELVTGAWPFGNPDSVLSELSRAAGDVPPRPHKALAGDLAPIAMKALDGHPPRRYESVRQFAADIQNYLAARPVTARPPTALYRTRKFLRRRWLPLSATAVFAIGLIAAAMVVLHQANVARAQALKAEKLNHFLNDVLSMGGGYRFDPRKFTVAEMLEMAEPRLQQGWKGDPRMEAELRLSLGSSYVVIHDWARARVHLEKALAIFRALEDDEQAVITLHRLASGAQLVSYDDALRYDEEAMAVLRRMGTKAPPLLTVLIKDQLAYVLALDLNRRHAEARELWQEAIALGQRDRQVPGRVLADVITHLAAQLQRDGEYAQAEAKYREALEIGRKDEPGGFWETGPLHGLMQLRAREGDFQAAVDFARQAHEVCLRTVGPDSPATASNAIVWIRYRADAGERGPIADELFAILPKIAKAFPPSTLDRLLAWTRAAHVLNLVGRFAEAERYARESADMADPTGLPEADFRRADSLVELGRALVGQGKYDRSLPPLARAETIYRALGPQWERDAAEARELMRRPAR
jgi:serine/threonine protein kinase